MPKLNADTMVNNPNFGVSGYGFSAVKLDALGASEYTLVVLAADNSGSVVPFAKGIEQAVSATVDSCRKSPRADNLLLRYLTFANTMEEQHGFKPLPDCAPEDYVGTIAPHGTTALYDTCFNAVESLGAFGATLTRSDFRANGILFVITDGEDVGSKMTRNSVRDAVAKLRREESLDSILLILIGVNVGGSTASYLTGFSTDVGFDQFVPLSDASAATLARLAQFISRSVSSQSQALGSGGPSQTLVF